MNSVQHKVFISYHHKNDQFYKDTLSEFGERKGIFIDMSVDSGDISDDLDDQAIRRKIRDEYLRDSTVIIVLVGTETKTRKHIDWEIYSSMYDGSVNKQLGVLVIQLPSTQPSFYTAPHGDKEKTSIYPTSSTWEAITGRQKYEERYPYLPARIIDNLAQPAVKISVTQWDYITNRDEILDENKIKVLIDLAFQAKSSFEYDLSRKMRRNNS